MKITIEPTNKQDAGNHPACTVSIQSPFDDLKIDAVVQMIADALKAFGYSEGNITQAFEDYEP